MEITVVYFEGCPHWHLAGARVAEAITAAKVTATVAHRCVNDIDEAQRIGFRGSPTILVDGIEPFATGDQPVGLACRLYRTDDGLDRSPSVGQLTRAITR